MRGEHESLTGRDPHDLLFGDDPDQPDDGDRNPRRAHEPRRADRHDRRRSRRSRRAAFVLAVVVLVLITAAALVGVRLYDSRYRPKDWSGPGTGSVQIVVRPGDSAGAIGTTLQNKGVIASARAFRNAASGSSAATNLGPGTYQLRKHMSAAAALAMLLDPSARLSSSVAVFEGATVFDVTPALAKALDAPQSQVSAAMQNVDALNLPSGYAPDSGSLNSVEGFLYPATYQFDPGTSATDALVEMITKFIDEDRATGFTGKAQAEHLTPYQALIIASIAEKEAKNPADYPKVARVILNRIAAHKPLQIDATSAYAAKIGNLDPTKVIYAQIDSPYNTYTHAGLPPTPIADPGPDALAGAVAPAEGDWLYYVNGDKDGNLFFTKDEKAFEQAVAKCKANNWGCG